MLTFEVRVSDHLTQKISHGPNDLPFHISQTNACSLAISNVTIFDLGKFEDLYYAACAKVQDHLHKADILLDNGFKSLHEDYFKYTCVPLVALNPVTLGEFKDCLLAQHNLLRGDQLMALLRQGINRVSLCNRTWQSTRGFIKDPNDSQHDREQMLSGQLSDDSIGCEQPSPKWLFRHEATRPRDWDHLNHTINMSSGMIFAQLAEKYRNTPGIPVTSQQNAGQTISSNINRGDSVANHSQEYVSPYNLDERAKKLYAAGAPDMPCICDPECICAPLCAGDLTQNCLCEENGLFARVTEGMDIDELDVPDLERRKKQGSADSISSKASASPARNDAPPQMDEMPVCEIIKAITDKEGASNEIRSQQLEQVGQEISRCGPSTFSQSSANGFDAILTGFDDALLLRSSQARYWAEAQSAPPTQSILFSPEALRRPISKECDTPPRRQSTRSIVTGRCFPPMGAYGSATNGVSIISDSLPTILAGSGRIAKSTSKRILAAVTTPSLGARIVDSSGIRKSSRNTAHPGA